MKQTFTGAVSALFDQLDAGNLQAMKELEILTDYGAYGRHAETEAELPFFQWEGGGRKLVCYGADHSLFLVQTSEVQGFEETEVLRDWFQVESEAHAEWLNTHWNGQALRFQYEGPSIWTSEEGLRWRRGKGEKAQSEAPKERGFFEEDGFEDLESCSTTHR